MGAAAAKDWGGREPPCLFEKEKQFFGPPYARNRLGIWREMADALLLPALSTAFSGFRYELSGGAVGGTRVQRF